MHTSFIIRNTVYNTDKCTGGLCCGNIPKDGLPDQEVL